MAASEYYDGQLEISDSASLAELADLPGARGVYVLFAADNTAITAVSAANMRMSLAGRLRADGREHSARRADLSGVAALVKWRKTYSRFESDMAYLDIVRQLWPTDFASRLPRRKSWFVYFADIETMPQLKAIDALSSAGIGKYYLGPFTTRKSADHYIELLTDVFDLCRYNSVLRQSPNGRLCAYHQMGRCGGPCAGLMDMSDYRQLAVKAWQFACGDISSWPEKLTSDMKAAASDQRFEQAASYKTRLENAARLGDTNFAHVCRADTLGFISIQRGVSRGKIRFFYVVGGAIVDCVDEKYPIADAQLKNICERFDAATIDESAFDPYGLSLVVQYLYSTAEHSGEVIHSRSASVKYLRKILDEKGPQLSRKIEKSSDSGDRSGRDSEQDDSAAAAAKPSEDGE